jgi:(p)ppGpp synthase/HD superfamily hydrolase
MHISFVSMEIMACLDVEKVHNGDFAVQTALLHDVLEDTQVTYLELAQVFGKKVAEAVLALTKNDSLTKEAQMLDSLERIKSQPNEVWIVKMADRIANLGPPPHYWNGNKISRYREEAIQIYNTLHTASDYLSKRLMEKIDAYRMYF